MTILLSIVLLLFFQNNYNVKQESINIVKEIDNQNKITKKLNQTIYNVSQLNETEIELDIFAFNQKKNEEYINDQNFFCNSLNLNLNIDYEKKINISKIELNNITFELYIYKDKDVVSDNIIKNKNWEPSETNELLNALSYFSNKKQTKKEDIYILDIGANIGWYSFFLGKYGYKILAFEPSHINFYITKKNYPLIYRKQEK
jgi:hypothetical protein